MDYDTDILLEAEGLDNFVGNLNLPSPQLLEFYKNKKERIIWIDKDIDESLLDEVRMILRYNKEDKDVPINERKPIKVFLQSYGGDAYSCMTFLDVVSLSKTPVYTYNMGIAMSAALYMLLAGHKRFALKSSQVMIHQGVINVGGDMVNANASVDACKKIIDIFRDYVLNRTDIDIKLYNKKKEKDWYLFAEDQVKYHIVDEIIDDVDSII